MPLILILILAFTLVAVAVAVLLMRPKSNQEGPDMEMPGFDYPTNDQDRQRPQLFGRWRISPNIIAFGQVTREPIEVEVGEGKNKTKQMVGYQIFVSMLWGISSDAERLREVYVNSVRKWAGSVLGYSTVSFQLGQSGDPDRKSDAPEAEMTFYSGSQTGPGLPYMGPFGFGRIPYKTTSLCYFPNAYIGDNARNVPPFEVVVEKQTFGIGFGDTWKNINDDCNPALAIYFILNKMLEIPSTKIDQTSFEDAAKILYNEGMGISFVMEFPRSASKWIEDIERVCDLKVFLEKATGKYKIKLVRDDYDVETIDEIDQTMVRGFVRTGRTYADLPTTAIFKWTNRATYEPIPFTLVNNALRSMLGYKKPESVDITMVTRPETARMVINRMMRRLFLPLAVYKFSTSTLHWDGNPGDVVMLNIPNWNLNRPVRVLSISGYSDASTEIELEVMEDVFGYGNFAELEIGNGDFISTDYALDLPVGGYLVKDALPEMVNFPAVAVLAYPEPTEISDAYDVRVAGIRRGEFKMSGTGTLVANYNAPQWKDEHIGFTIQNCVNVSAFSNSDGAWQRMSKVAVIDSGGENWEVVSIKTLTDLGGSQFQAVGVLRGIAGTPQPVHNAGTRVYILPFTGNDQTGIVDVTNTGHSSIPIAIRPVNAFSYGPEATINYAYGNRVETPYPVMDLQATKVGSDITFTWIPRRRHSACAYNNPDNFPVRVDPHEGEFVITSTGGLDDVTDVPTYNHTEAAVRTYTVKCRLNGFESPGVQITI